MTFDWFRRRFDQDKSASAQPADPTPDEPETIPETAPEPPATAEVTEEETLNWAKIAYENIRKRQQEEAAAQAALQAAATVTPDVATPGVTASDPATAEVTAPEVTAPEVAAPEVAATEPVASEPAAPDAVVPELVSEPIAESLEVAPLESAIVAEPAQVTPEPETELEAESAVEPEPEAEPESLESPESPEWTAEIAPSTLTPADVTPEASPEPVLDVAPESSPEPELATPVPFWVAAEAERQARLEQLRETAIVEPEPDLRPTATAPVAPPPLPDFVLDEGFLWSAEVLASQGRRPDDISLEEITWLNKLRQGLDKTRRGLINQLRAIMGQGPLNQDAVLEIESALLQADVGVAATDAIIAALQDKLRADVLPPDAAIVYLKQILRDMLDHPIGDTINAAFAPQKDTLNIWLITGVNGAGKTTTIGKLAHIAQKSGYKCLIAAADTFRAAAVEQVKVWGERSQVEVIANPGKNTDPAAVVFDAIAAAQARGADLLLVDTAGRLQNKKNLMDELSKVRRIIDKKAPNAVVESLLVLDSTLGQNGLRQAEVFSEAAQLSGVVLTKLDGTAKGGIALAVVKQLDLPIRFIGAGEGIEDLRPFSSYEFVEALLNG